jgi:4-amino-4-deoxy-L-arabinose transferase-like glycosyltransferase
MTAAGAWLRPSLVAVLAVTLLRLLALALNRTDLFVDESQYWLWGQNLDLGYYSKPPLIAWLIRGVTDLAGSDAPFWVRLPGAVLHGMTALILAALAARLFGARAAFWTGLAYVTAPFTAVGSLLISTDTVMAPAYAAALWFWFRLAETRAARFALLAGAAAGLAFLAKYAAVYFLLGAGLSALVLPAMRIGWRNAALLLVAFAAVIAPNVIWNLGHDLTTVSHTMDNVGWVRTDSASGGLNPPGLAEFFFSQFAVFGPVLFGALLLGWARPPQPRGESLSALLLFSLPILAIVCAQALMSKAYANWAVATYFAGTPLAVAWLLARAPKLLWLSLAVNGLFAVALPVLTITAPAPDWNGAPLLKRYLGRAELSRQIIATARAEGVAAVYVGDRDILADLFYTGADSGLAFHAPRPIGRPRNYYEQMFALPPAPPPALYILSDAPVCGGAPVAPVAEFDTTGGAYAGRRLAAWRLPEGCADAF